MFLHSGPKVRVTSTPPPATRASPPTALCARYTPPTMAPSTESYASRMAKQGAILLGNGGDNSNGSQGTFYEGAMTAAGTFPSDATDQLVQANIVAAQYRALPLTVAPASATAAPPGLQTFSPGSSEDTTVTFTNTTGAPAAGVRLSISLPNKQWTSFIQGSAETSKTFSADEPGASVGAPFRITSGHTPFNGDIVANARWKDETTGAKQLERTPEKVRNGAETRKIQSLGTVASNPTTLWQTLPEGPGSPSRPGRPTCPSQACSASRLARRSPLATAPHIQPWPEASSGTRWPPVTAVGKPGTQNYLAVDAPTGATNIQVTSVANISVGDKIRLDIDSVGHGIETVTVTRVNRFRLGPNLERTGSPIQDLMLGPHEVKPELGRRVIFVQLTRIQ